MRTWQTGVERRLDTSFDLASSTYLALARGVHRRVSAGAQGEEGGAGQGRAVQLEPRLTVSEPVLKSPMVSALEISALSVLLTTRSI